MNLNYAKTILYAYKCLDVIMRQLDELVVKRAVNSMRDLSPCEAQCEKIIALTEQKDLLIDLKLKTKSALEKFTDEEMDCLDYKYFKFKSKEYYADYDFTSRAYFRKQVRVAGKFAKRIENAGITDEIFAKKYLEIDFFRELLKRVIERENNFLRPKEKLSPLKFGETA